MEGLTIGEFEIARIVAEWIEVLAVIVIAVAVVVSMLGGLIVRFPHCSPFCHNNIVLRYHFS